MKPLLTYLFNTWWRPVLLNVLVTVLVLIFIELNVPFLNKFFDMLSIACFFLLLISIFYQLYKGRYLESIASFVVLLIVAFLHMTVLILDGDHWADDLQIPEGIQIEEPINASEFHRPYSSPELG